MKKIFVLLLIFVLITGCGLGGDASKDKAEETADIIDEEVAQSPNTSKPANGMNSVSDDMNDIDSDMKDDDQEEAGFWSSLNDDFKGGDIPKGYPHDVAPLYRGEYKVLGGSEFPAGSNGEIGYSVILASNSSLEDINNDAFQPIADMADSIAMDMTVNGYRTLIAYKDGWSITINAGSDTEIGYESFIDYMVVQQGKGEGTVIQEEKPESIVIDIDTVEDADNDDEVDTYTMTIGDQDVFFSEVDLPEGYPMDLLPLYTENATLVYSTGMVYGETGEMYIIDLGTNEDIEDVNEKAFDYLLKHADSIEMDMTNDGMRMVYASKDGWEIIQSTIDNESMGGDDEYSCYIEYSLMYEE